MKVRFWMDTDSGREVEVIGHFSEGVLDYLDVFDHSLGFNTKVTLNESELERADQRAIAAYESEDE